MMKSNGRYKRNIILFVVCIMCLFFVACTNNGSIKNENSTQSSAGDSSGNETEGEAGDTTNETPTNISNTPTGVSVEDEELSVLTGIVYDATMNAIMVKDANNKIYNFVKKSEVVEAGNWGVLIGSPVTIMYHGKLNESDMMQTVEVEKIIVTEPTTNLEKAQFILANMTLEEKVGQMFLVRVPKENEVGFVSQFYFGGYLLFARDFEHNTKEEVIQKIGSYQQASDVPMFVGVDEEGGSVTRISKYKQFRDTKFLSPRELYETGGWDAIINDTVEKAELLKSLGINLNMAPVCDVTYDKTDYMYQRSFGGSVKETAEYVERVVETMVEQQMGSVLKHFPGYGNNVDTHTGIAYDERSYTTFVNNDFIPFLAGIRSGASAILVSHNIIESVDTKYPASLSKKVHEILRDELGFTGVIMTDDLSMEAIGQYTASDEAAILAVEAGNDLICCTDYEVQIPAVIHAVNQGTISENRIEESVLRILLCKLELGIIDE